MSSSVKFAKNCYDCFIDKQGCESESPGTFRCKRCKGKNKWCWFLCEKYPEIYEIVPKVFLRHPKNSSITDIEITPG
ncbi:26368_t:CDS:2 [Gigaspora margarita]|uniref:26368_t:CDS:1 n=1 Tax=Gigaspora margarita TaxID=4874 RepID=A0ABN7UW90_GIGMA|nr:26368_t:CDS:2 [Gigaspora margarita]